MRNCITVNLIKLPEMVHADSYEYENAEIRTAKRYSQDKHQMNPDACRRDISW